MEFDQTETMLGAGARLTPSLVLERPLGAGGMGQVWIARHEGLGTQVVVKLIARELVRNPEAIARFSREANAAAQVRSPHVVQVFDHGLTASGQPYIAMELLEGESLRSRLDRERALPARDVVAIVAQCAKALTRAHEKGLVHRDIKPDNVFLTETGGDDLFVKVLDFGIAKATNDAFGATATGAMLGSPYYMSPEQVVGAKNVDHRTDLWALGVMTFEALTGARPFNGETIGALSIAICHGDAPRPTQLQPKLPAAFDGWFARACARNAADRFASAREMADALEVALRGSANVPLGVPEAFATTKLGASTTAGIGVSTEPPARANRWRVAVVGLGVAVIGALAGVTAWALTSGRQHAAERAAPEETVAAPVKAGSPKPAATPTAVAIESVSAAASVAASTAPTTPGKPKPTQKASAAPAASSALPGSPPPIAPPVPKLENDPKIY